jgi:hypothetical protein
MMRHAFAMLALLAAASPAEADDRPPLRPTRDVEVEYRTTGMPQAPMGGPMGAPGSSQGGGANARTTTGTLTIHYAVKGNWLRIEGMNGRGYAIIDRDAGRMTIVMTERQMYLEMPHDLARDASGLGGLEAAGATFKKLGTETVAGLGCTNYETSNNDRKGKICLTDDGVWLRASSDDPNHRRDLVATKVTFTSQSASLFEPPAGFQKLDIPAVPGGMPPGMGGMGMGGTGMGPSGAPRGGMPGTPGMPPAR